MRFTNLAHTSNYDALAAGLEARLYGRQNARRYIRDWKTLATQNSSEHNPSAAV